ncbi:MAG: Nramp family divalent metal transporter [Sporomusaceae bacterium]|nr:Nramp family divalent metal transporter [Sporomusaceae bacterium]
MKDENFVSSPMTKLPVLSDEVIRQKAQGLFKYLGPAFIVSVAYMDPGNFGTNISGGSQFGYNLLWVILWSNFMAIFVQILSAKLGIATGMNLPEHCGRFFSRKMNWIFWSVATVAAMATDLAEFLGGVLGFNLLFGIPLVWAATLTGVITYSICHLQKYGQKIIERIITTMVAVISLAYIGEMFIAKPAWNEVFYHTAVPFLSSDSILVAVGMLGATVMPHVIYLHSQLVQTRRRNCLQDCLHHFKMAKIEVFIAMNMAFIVNAAMVIVASSVFKGNGLEIGGIEEAYLTLQPLMGNMAAGAFGIALLASGLSSSTVGTMAGEVILKGFLGFDLKASLRRLITMLPALGILMSGINPMEALVYSQVILSFALPAAIIPLMILTNQANIMGTFKNTIFTNVLGWIVVTVIVLLNMILLYLTLSSR